MLLKQAFCSFPNVADLNPCTSAVGQVCFSHRISKNNREIRALFQRDIVTTPYVVPYWTGLVGDIPWKKVWTLPMKYLLINKVREVTYKLIHRYYPSKSFIVRMKKDLNDACSFCEGSPETSVHLFWFCPHSSKFWTDLLSLLCTRFNRNFEFSFKHVLFGFHDFSREESNVFYIINLVFILAKFFIHKCKYTNCKPLLSIFTNDINAYHKTLQSSTNPKAIKTVLLLGSFHLCDKNV